MKVVNPEGLGVGVVPGRIGHPAHSMTVVIKSVWALEPGRLRTLLHGHPLLIPTGDLPAGDDDEVGAPLRYANDLVPWKPRADLLLVGQCHPPGGRPVRRCSVRFQVGETGLTLEVHGDRWWDGSSVVPRPTEAGAFTSMPLGWGQAWGGPDVAANPAGKGAGAIELADGQEAWPLPNVERADQPIRSPDEAPPPASFGPVAPTWAPRAGAAGTYDQRWLDTRWPWYADDLDPSFFCAAPAGLRPPGFLRGNEAILLRNLVEGSPDFETRLPGRRPRCFLHALPEGHPHPPRRAADREEWEEPPAERMQFREVGLQLDTVWVDSEEGVVSLVWRGHAQVSGERAEEVLDLFVFSEDLEETPRDRASCRARFRALLDAEEADEVEGADPESAGGPGDGETEPDEGEADGETPEPDPLDWGEDPFGSEERLSRDLEARGLPQEAPPPELTDEEIERTLALLRDKGQDEGADALASAFASGSEDPDEGEVRPEPWTRQRVVATHEAGESLRGEDLAGLDLSGLDLAGIDLRGARLEGSDLSGTLLTGGRLDEADLVGARLDGADMEEAVLVEARLDGASFRNAAMTGVVATGARAPKADMEGATLDDGLLDGLHAPGLRLLGASLKDAGLAGAILEGGYFRGATLDGSVLSGAILDDADFTDASLDGVEFDGATARGAIFHRASMEGFRGAQALDLSGADFTQIRAPGSVWSGTRLRETIFAWARLEEADFADADLTAADFWAAHLRGARFERASLVDARLARADGFEVTFEEADLVRADLRGGNFHGSEFLGSRMESVLAEGANLEMTKHG